jgi:pilus assembly protein Flp/PilA
VRFAATSCQQKPPTQAIRPLGVNRARDIRIARGDALRRIPMKAFANVISSFVRNEDGQDLLEYALLVALIALVCVGAITAAGTNVNTIFANIAAAL